MSASQRSDANGDEDKFVGHKIMLQSEQYKAYAHNGYVYSMLLAKGLFLHDGEEEVLITAGGGGDIKLWKIDSLLNAGLVQLFQFKNRGYSALSLAYSGTFLYAGLSEGTAHVYNLSSCQLVQRLNIGTADVSQIQVNQGLICCGTSDGWIKVGITNSHHASADLCSGSAPSFFRSMPGSRTRGGYLLCLRRTTRTETSSSQVATITVSLVGTSRIRKCLLSPMPPGVMVRVQHLLLPDIY